MVSPYTPYGALTVYDATWANLRSTSSYATGYTHTGRQLVAETGLYYHRVRVYSAQLGRFCSRDPIGYSYGVSLHDYVSDSPTTWTDPSGNRPQFPGKGQHGNKERKHRLKIVENWIKADLERFDRYELTYDDAWDFYKMRCPNAEVFPCRTELGRGCVGITSCFIGRPIAFGIEKDFQLCFGSLDQAKTKRDSLNATHFCSKNGEKNMNGEEA